MSLQQLFPVLRDEHGMKLFCACGCGRRARHIHHIIAQCRGGSDEPNNRMAVCQKCHVSIHSKQGDFAQWGKMGGSITAQKKVSIPNLKQFRGPEGAIRFAAYLDRQATAQMGWTS